MGTTEHPTASLDTVSIVVLFSTVGPYLCSNSDPKTVDDDEYTMFYTATFKDFSKPLAWHHFSGDSASGVPFKAIIYIPSKLYVVPLLYYYLVAEFDTAAMTTSGHSLQPPLLGMSGLW